MSRNRRRCCARPAILVPVICATWMGDLRAAEVQDGPTLFPAPKTALSGGPTDLILADLDQDGHLDAVASSTGGIEVCLGVGDGRLEPAASYAGPGAPTLTVADFDGDGVLDVVTADRPELVFYAGVGDGSFAAAVVDDTTLLGSEFSQHVRSADLDGDGNQDLAVTRRGNGFPFTSLVAVLLGNGDGTFGAPTSNPTTSLYVGELAIGDLDGDGALDLAVANFGNSVPGDVSILLGVGDGTFAPAFSQAAGTRPTSIELVDFDGDTVLDVVVSNSSGSLGSMLFGVGDGTFAAPVVVGPGASSGVQVAVGDFDADGNPDLGLLRGIGVSSLHVAYGTGGGGFTQPTEPASAFRAEGMASGDLDSDGLDDLVLGELVDLTTLRALPSQAFDEPVEYDSLEPIQVVASGDFDEDGLPDLAALDGVDALNVYLGTGDGSFGPAAAHAVGVDAEAIVVADLDGDAHQDLAVPRAVGSVEVLLGDGTGAFVAAPSVPVAPTAVGPILAVGDLDGDGNLDLATTNDFFPNQVGGMSVAFGRGDGTFDPFVTIALPTLPGRPVIDDFNEDGIDDIVVALPPQDTANLILGNANGSLIAGPVFSVGNLSFGPGPLTSTDLDADGHRDLLIANIGPIRLLAGNGDGTFGPPVALPGGFSASALAVTDVDGDSRLDVVSHNGTVTVQRGNGDGTFQPEQRFGGHVSQLTIADFDADGVLDLASPSVDSGLALHFGTGRTLAPVFYCTPKVSSAGCLARLVVSTPAELPVSGAGDYALDACGVHSFRNGLLFGSPAGAAMLPFDGGSLCVVPPLKRGPLMNSGGSGPNACDGAYSTTVNGGLVFPLGLDAGPGSSANYQYWYRDPQNPLGTIGSALSNAVELEFL